MRRKTRVRSHCRKVKGRKVTVKSHYRSVVSHVRSIKDQYGIGRKVDVRFEKAEQSDSLAHAETQMKKVPGGYMPKRHILRIDPAKIAASGESLRKIVAHEMGHVVDIETLAKKRPLKKPTEAYSTTEEGRNMMKRKGAYSKRRSSKENFGHYFQNKH